MIRRPPRSTQSRSSAASDVYKRQTVVCVCFSWLFPIHVPFAPQKESHKQFTVSRLVGSVAADEPGDEPGPSHESLINGPSDSCQLVLYEVREEELEVIR